LVTVSSVDSKENYLKIVATRCHILKLKCTKFDVGWGSASDPAGGAYSAPTPADISCCYLAATCHLAAVSVFIHITQFSAAISCCDKSVRPSVSVVVELLAGVQPVNAPAHRLPSAFKTQNVSDIVQTSG